MALMGSSDYARANSKNKYQTSHSGGLSPGFLTPPSPYEGRRDSNASSQSSMSSFTSYTSDYSIPATPTYGPSPLGESFVDIMSYDMPLHGLPLHPGQKRLATGEHLNEWSMVHQTEQAAAHSMSFHPQSVLPTAGEFGSILQAQLGDHHSLNGPSWDNDSTMAWPGERHMGFSIDNRLAELAEHCDLWSNEMQQPQAMFVQTMIPSDVMLVDDDFVHVHSDPYDSANSLDNVGPSFPQSPQEVCFKREDSFSVKQEPGLDEGEGRPKRSMYVLPTGAKSVQKERRSGCVPKKKKKKSKSPKQRDFVAYGIEVTTRVEMDPRTGEYRQIERAEVSRCPCPWEEADGSVCGKLFKRQEHMKRHLVTHKEVKPHSCLICAKLFGRNDNCQDHYYTHVKKPGKKDGRNDKYTLREVEEFVACSEKGGPKLVEKLRQKWRKDFKDLPADCLCM